MAYPLITLFTSPVLVAVVFTRFVAVFNVKHAEGMMRNLVGERCNAERDFRCQPIDLPSLFAGKQACPACRGNHTLAENLAARRNAAKQLVPYPKEPFQ